MGVTTSTAQGGNYQAIGVFQSLNRRRSDREFHIDHQTWFPQIRYYISAVELDQFLRYAQAKAVASDSFVKPTSRPERFVDFGFWQSWPVVGDPYRDNAPFDLSRNTDLNRTGFAGDPNS
jgi:hypothetical protein